MSERAEVEVEVAEWLRRRSHMGDTLTLWDNLTHQARRQWLEEARGLLQLIDTAEGQMPTSTITCAKCGVTYSATEAHTCLTLTPPGKRLEEGRDNWKHRAENMRCQTCMWYVPKNDKLGRCRFNAPTIKGWPAMFPGDWCGQHKLDEDSV